MQNLKKYLKNINVCHEFLDINAYHEFLEWASNRKTSRYAWLSCPKAEWLFLLAKRIGIDKNLIILAACDIAESVLHLVPENEERPRKAIETTRAFVAGKATKQEVCDARCAAAIINAGKRAIDIDDIAYAINAAQASAGCIFNTYSAYYSASSAIKASYKKQKEIVDIIRKRIPWEIWKDKLELKN